MTFGPGVYPVTLSDNYENLHFEFTEQQLGNELLSRGSLEAIASWELTRIFATQNADWTTNRTVYPQNQFDMIDPAALAAFKIHVNDPHYFNARDNGGDILFGDLERQAIQEYADFLTEFLAEMIII